MTAIDDALGTVLRLGIAAEALGALAARLRADVDGVRLDRDVASGLDAVVDRLDVDIASLTVEERRRVAMSARALLLLAVDLARDPGRAPGWTLEDPNILLSTGQLSANIAGVIGQVAPALDGLGHALGREGARFLDVGAGVAALSIALCEAWPGLRVVGLEPWAAARRLAASEVASSGVAERIELWPVPVEQLGEDAVFDAAWLASPFVATAVIPAALARLHDALKPGAWLLLGRFAGPPDPLADAVTRLRVVRSGGSLADTEQLSAQMRDAGLTDVHELTRSWQAPVAFIVGRRPPR